MTNLDALQLYCVWIKFKSDTIFSTHFEIEFGHIYVLCIYSMTYIWLKVLSLKTRENSGRVFQPSDADRTIFKDLRVERFVFSDHNWSA